MDRTKITHSFQQPLPIPSSFLNENKKKASSYNFSTDLYTNFAEKEFIKEDKKDITLVITTESL